MGLSMAILRLSLVISVIALKFDGNDNVTFPTNGVPTGNSPMSWSAWFKREVTDGGGVQYIATFGFSALLRQILRYRDSRRRYGLHDPMGRRV